MNKEDKELLLKDLSARLLYGVRGKVKADTVVPHEYDIDGFPLETTFDVDVKLQRIDASNDEIFVSTFDNNEDLGDYIEECQENTPWTIEGFIPYLRPMSSMTEEEKKEYHKTKIRVAVQWDDYNNPIGFELVSTFKTFDWLNAHHFDFRNLIKRGLAIEAPSDMYKID